MQIAGLQKLTLIDYPGEVAATVFTRGCNLRCGYCHNPELVLPQAFNPLLDTEDIFLYLKQRVGKISGVCITGGEPLLQPDIESFIDAVKSLGYKVKLDTNGTLSARLAGILDSGKVDYVAMDVKTSPGKYSLLTQTSVWIDCIKESINFLINSKVNYEFRTTIYKPHHDESDFFEIGELIKGAKRYAIQNFVRSKHVGGPEFLGSFSHEEIADFRRIMKNFVDEIIIRA